MDEMKKELEDYFCRFTFGQFVTLILLEIVTLFFVFYLGAHYGPDLIGNKTSVSATDVSALPEGTSKTVDEIVGIPPMDYTYPKVLTGNEGENPTGGAVKVKPSGMTAEEYEQQAREKTVKARENPEKVPETQTSLASPPPSVGALESPSLHEENPARQFTIQVGSYQSKQEAESSLSHWKKKGYSVFMTVGEIPDRGTWYRIRIGGFSDRKAADTYLQKFKVKEKVSALVVPTKS